MIRTLFLLLLGCSGLEAPPEAPVSESRAPTSTIQPAAADHLGIELSYVKRERSRDSHTLSTTIRLQDEDLTVVYGATGRAKGREKPSRTTRLEPTQRDAVLEMLREAGLLEARQAAGPSGSEFTEIDLSISVWQSGGSPIRSSVRGLPEEAGTRDATIQRDDLFRAISRLQSHLERIE